MPVADNSHRAQPIPRPSVAVRGDVRVVSAAILQVRTRVRHPGASEREDRTPVKDCRSPKERACTGCASLVNERESDYSIDERLSIRERPKQKRFTKTILYAIAEHPATWNLHDASAVSVYDIDINSLERCAVFLFILRPQVILRYRQKQYGESTLRE